MYPCIPCILYCYIIQFTWISYIYYSNIVGVGRVGRGVEVEACTSIISNAGRISNALRNNRNPGVTQSQAAAAAMALDHGLI